MNIWIWILLIASVILGVAYTVLGLQANDHLNENNSKTERSIGWLFWWSFSKEKYDEEGRKLCAQGQLLAFALLALYAGWYFALLKK
jgi:type IV secretory pathway TraG/TraD family ATPase VirD4